MDRSNKKKGTSRILFRLSISVGKLLYNLGIGAYAFSVHLAKPFNPKARKWLNGRKQQKLSSHPNSIWFHCASLGEFEQARPVIEEIKKHKKEQKIVITFFSPSGYEIRKDYELADAVYYLPPDTRANANHFIETVQPSRAIFVKYEVWHHFFQTIKSNNIPLYLISATFRKDQIYFKWHGGFMKNTLNLVDQIFTQNQASTDLLTAHGFKNVTTAGDTRFDRVLAQASKSNSNDLIEKFKGDSILIIAGSSWPLEENLLAASFPQLPKSVKLLIAPHDVSVTHINDIEKKFDGAIRYSTGKHDGRVMILDSIGQLASAYSYGDIAMVGGGFTNALHNILEPATFGIPVIYGNNHPKYPEGSDLANAGGGFSVSKEGFSGILTKLVTDNQFRNETGNNARRFVENHAGATNTILSRIEQIS